MYLLYVPPTDPVLFNHIPDLVCGHMAVRLLRWMAVLPDKLLGHTRHPVCKLLQTGWLFFFLLFFYIPDEERPNEMILVIFGTMISLEYLHISS